MLFVSQKHLLAIIRLVSWNASISQFAKKKILNERYERIHVVRILLLFLEQSNCVANAANSIRKPARRTQKQLKVPIDNRVYNLGMLTTTKSEFILIS